jgi:Lipase maturation factor
VLGLVYLVAFASAAIQIEGLVGSRGILPAAELLGWIRQRTGAERFWMLPTLFWLGASDVALRCVAWSGVAISAGLVAGLAPAAALAVLWALYLSIASVGLVFFGYQWDALLLETGLLAVFLAPPTLRLARGGEPSRVALWLLRFLLFRLTFASGVVKLRSGDEAWRTLSALRVHYETQPLPTWVGWYAHQLPARFQQFSCVLMFLIELGVPWLIFAGRRARLLALWPLLGLQALIALTGNYAFFNLLTMALCVLLLDDEALPWRAASRPCPGTRWPRLVVYPFAATTGVLAFVSFVAGCGVELPWPRPLVTLHRWVAPLRSVNAYGLFAVMTTSRAEIQIEGSNDDGVTWKAYQFFDKPGDMDRAPRFIAPHQPRLDWQMWFAALGRCDQNPWFERFLERLQEGSPAVLGLLATNPFPEGPTRLRSVVYDYRFTDRETRRRTGAWWRREAKGLYCRELGVPGRVEPGLH